MSSIQARGVKGHDAHLLWAKPVVQPVQRRERRADERAVGQGCKVLLPIGQKPAGGDDDITSGFCQRLLEGAISIS